MEGQVQNEPGQEYPNAHPELNPVDVFRVAISDELHRITNLDKQQIFDALAWTSTLDKGDLIVAVPRFRVKGVPPEQLAQEWASKFPPHPLLKPPSTISFNLRFDFAPAALPDVVLKRVLNLGDSYGNSPQHGLRDPSKPSSGRKKIVIEFSSPNIAKKFHAGHLRSTIIGGFLSNLYAGGGWDVLRMNYLGDWGRQYGLLALGWKRYGSEDAFASDPVGHLFDIYVKISADFAPEEEAFKLAGKNREDTAVLESQGLLGAAKDYFKRMEDGDEEALSLWRRFRDLSIGRYKETYARLNIHFDEYSGESQVLQSTMEEVEAILKEKGIVHLDNGAWIVDVKRYGAKKLDVAVVRNRNGTSNYLLRDIGAAVQRQRTHNMDRMIYVVMSEQETHLLRLFKILSLMGGEYASLATKLQHVTFGKVMGMSTRRGTVKFLDDILSDVSTAMHTVMRSNEIKYAQIPDPEKVSDTLGISAIMCQDMSAKRINNYDFDMARMTSFEGDTGPYLQYAHARLCSIARNSGLVREDLHNADLSLLKEPHAIDLLRLMSQYPDVVGQTLKTLEPTTVLTYLFKLTHQLSSGYDVLRVVGAAEGVEVMRARAALYEGARQVIGNGMRVLGLSPVER
ncbi:arginyl-tRNA synthetase [Elsinoe ampelina]|uniref:arginine--tRNA ligase n=1 Tax=Elsinoe ampelina TaxID=302913 RepID=A0A6A6FXB8_9PEZI|nr:arginyl-tRNA synthetase [Elsinoe ampelina]